MWKRECVLLLVSLGIFLANCTTAPPETEPCSIVNFDLAECTNIKTGEVTDKDLKEMLGYTCFSPQDLSDIKKWLKKILESASRDLKVD